MRVRGSSFCIGGPDSVQAETSTGNCIDFEDLERLWGFVLGFFKTSMLFPIQEMFGKLRIFVFFSF